MSIQFKNDKWYAVVYYRDEFNKKKYEWIPASGQKEAERIERNRRTDKDNGRFVISTKSTVKEFLEKWLSLEIRPHKRPSTVANYENQVKALNRNLSEANLGKLKAMTIQEHLNLELKRGLKPTSIQYQFSVLKQALDKAVIWEIITRNPCDAVNRPQRNDPKNGIFTFEEVISFLNYIEKTKIYLIAVLGFFCGLRREEILGLRWLDVDIKGKNIFVRNGLYRDKTTGKLTLGGVKTKKSKDYVPLPDIVIEALKNERKRQMQLKDKVIFKNRYVVCHDDGQPYDPSYITHAIPKLIKRYNENLEKGKSILPVIRVHDMRHSYVTMLYELGLDTKAVSEAARHARSSFTNDYYVHLRKSVKHRPAEVLNLNFAGISKGLEETKKASPAQSQES